MAPPNARPPGSGCTQIIDTFPSFEAFWPDAEGRPPERQAEMWAARFRSDWSDLAEKLEAEYAADGTQPLDNAPNRLPHAWRAATNWVGSLFC